MRSEIIIDILMILSTLIVLWKWICYILHLRYEMKRWVYIYKDRLHTLQHIAIAWVKILMSLAFTIIWLQVDLSWLSLVVLFNNMALILIVLPHLQSEK